MTPQYSYKISFDPHRGTYEVFRYRGGQWWLIRHPQGKTLLTRQHAINFMNWHRRKPKSEPTPQVYVTEYFY